MEIVDLLEINSSLKEIEEKLKTIDETELQKHRDRSSEQQKQQVNNILSGNYVSCIQPESFSIKKERTQRKLDRMKDKLLQITKDLHQDNTSENLDFLRSLYLDLNYRSDPLKRIEKHFYVEKRIENEDLKDLTTEEIRERYLHKDEFQNMTFDTTDSKERFISHLEIVDKDYLIKNKWYISTLGGWSNEYEELTNKRNWGKLMYFGVKDDRNYFRKIELDKGLGIAFITEKTYKLLIESLEQQCSGSEMNLDEETILKLRKKSLKDFKHLFDEMDIDKIPHVRPIIKIHKERKNLSKLYNLRPITCKGKKSDYNYPENKLILSMVGPLINNHFDKVSGVVKNSQYEIGLSLDQLNNEKDIIWDDYEIYKLDSVGMYDNIEHKDLLISWKEFLLKSKLNVLNIDFWVKLLEKVLENIYFKIGKTIYRQKKGIPQGSSISPLLSYILLIEQENEIRETFPNEVKILNRYIDDIFSIIPKNRPDIKKRMIEIYKKSKLDFTVDETNNNYIGLSIKIVPELNKIVYMNSQNIKTWSKLSMLKKSKKRDSRKQLRSEIQSRILEYRRLTNIKSLGLFKIEEMERYLNIKNELKRRILFKFPEMRRNYNGTKKLNREYDNLEISKNELKIYTDGGLKDGKLSYGTYFNKEGLKPIIGTLKIDPLRSKGIIKSSTLSELGGIYSSLIQTKKFIKNRDLSVVTINTDSQTSIDIINNIIDDEKNDLNPLRTKSHIENLFSSRIKKIVDEIRNKKIRLNFKKIKGHSGILGNEIVDYLSSLGRNLNRKVRDKIHLLEIGRYETLRL